MCNTIQLFEHVRPPIKWAGGKTQLLSQFQSLFPSKFTYYLEPFLGGGAVFFHLQPHKAYLSDNNSELINFYIIVRDNLELLVKDLKKHVNEKDYFYKVRKLNPTSISSVERASRFLFLNKTAFNGLYRVNSKGGFNAPFGYYDNPKILDIDNLHAVSLLLQGVSIRKADFGEVLDFAEEDSFIYMDPPYVPLSDTANFTGYTANSFNLNDQKRLADVFRKLDNKGCLVMLSNSNTQIVRDLYEGYNISEVQARRAINSRGDKRGPITELVVRNYG